MHGSSTLSAKREKAFAILLKTATADVPRMNLTLTSHGTPEYERGCDDFLYRQAVREKIDRWMKPAHRENSVQIRLLGSSEDLLEAWKNGLRVHLLCPDIETSGEMSGMETRVFALLGMNGIVGMKFTGLYSVSAREAAKPVIAYQDAVAAVMEYDCRNTAQKKLRFARAGLKRIAMEKKRKSF